VASIDDAGGSGDPAASLAEGADIALVQCVYVDLHRIGFEHSQLELVPLEERLDGYRVVRVQQLDAGYERTCRRVQTRERRPPRPGAATHRRGIGLRQRFTLEVVAARNRQRADRRAAVRLQEHRCRPASGVIREHRLHVDERDGAVDGEFGGEGNAGNAAADDQNVAGVHLGAGDDLVERRCGAARIDELALIRQPFTGHFGRGHDRVKGLEITAVRLRHAVEIVARDADGLCRACAALRIAVELVIGSDAGDLVPQLAVDRQPVMMELGGRDVGETAQRKQVNERLIARHDHVFGASGRG